VRIEARDESDTREQRQQQKQQQQQQQQQKLPMRKKQKQQQKHLDTTSRLIEAPEGRFVQTDPLQADGIWQLIIYIS
jgi:Skp family chaperone for outer membrane proteins